MINTLTDLNTKPLINDENEQRDESLIFDTDFDPTKIFYYCYDKNGNYTGAVYSDNQPEESTKIQPVKPYVNADGHAVEGITVGMTNPKWDGEKWVDSFVPDTQSDSTAQQQINASVMVDMLALKQANAAQAKVNANLMLDNMQLKAAVTKLTAQVAAPAESETQADSQSQSTSTSTSESASVSASESQAQPTATTAETPVQG